MLREGVMNALMHRDYSIKGSNIKIAIFDSKIEITSPGGLPKSLTIEDIYSGRSEIRNRVISNLLLKSGYVEQWGSGIPRMIAMCKEAGLKLPEIEEKGLFIVLRIYRKGKLQSKRLEYTVDDMKTKTKELTKSKSEAIADKVYLAETSTQRRLKALQDSGVLYLEKIEKMQVLRL